MKNIFTQATYSRAVFAFVLIVFTQTLCGQEIKMASDEIPYIKDSYTYKIVDNHEIQADVYRYPGEELRPGIIWLHGGALIIGTRGWLPSEQMKFYLKAGYTVISIDYRLAPETKLAEIIEDLEDAYAWVRSEGPKLFNIDADRIAIVGHSAGGYLTLMAGCRLKPSPKALVSFYGYGDITGSWYSRPDSFYNKNPTITLDQALEFIGNTVISSPPPEPQWPNGRAKFYLYCRQQGLWPREVSGHDPLREQEWFSDYEPLRNVTSKYPPTVLLHGEKDTDVPFEQSVLMAGALKQYDVTHEFIRNPEWGHMFDATGMEDQAVQEAFNKVLKFLESHVKK